MKPGLTCLWQVSGRNEVKNFEQWVKLDLRIHRQLELVARSSDSAKNHSRGDCRGWGKVSRPLIPRATFTDSEHYRFTATLISLEHSRAIVYREESPFPMKEIKFKLGDHVLSGQLGSRIEKKALYGYSRRVAEKDGRILSRGALSADGRLLRRDEIAAIKIDPDGSPVDEIVTELDGALAELKPSVFEQDNPLAEVPLIRLASFTVTDVYPIDELGPEARAVRHRILLSQESPTQGSPPAGQGTIRDFSSWARQSKQPSSDCLFAYSFFDTEGGGERGRGGTRLRNGLTLMNTIHLDSQGKTARVLFQSLPQASPEAGHSHVNEVRCRFPDPHPQWR
jgi:hypothetical protein